MGVEALEPNRVLAGRYRLESRLGQGGMGAIWRAEHLVLQAPVAVKLIDREAVPDEDTLSRFMREAKSAATLRSPHVVQIIDYGVDGTVPFMVMELLEGENLAQRLKRVRRLSRQETSRVLTHVGRAVARAHEAGIVHRDLKPENVFLVHNEDEEIAKVLDFGVAKIDEAGLGPEGTRTRTGSILGTPYYMSPEQAQGNKTLDSRSDLWSLGVIAFECLTGQRPFYSDGLGDLVLTICVRDLPVPSDVAPVPLGFDTWFAKACAREPENRFQTARELTDALREALGLDVKETTSFDSPDVVVASSKQPSSRPPPPAITETPTVVQPDSSPRSRTRADAQTLVGPVAALAQAAELAPTLEPGHLAPTEELFGTTHYEPPPEPKSHGTALVLMVAVVALGAGLIGGLMFLRQPRHTGGLDTATLPAPAAPPDSAEADEKAPKHPKKHGAEEGTATTEGSSATAPAETATAAAEPLPAASNTAAVDGGAKLEHHAPNELAPVPLPLPTTEEETPDASIPWEKPEWARPDNEIPVRRGPGEEDDTIVIPSDQ